MGDYREGGNANFVPADSFLPTRHILHALTALADNCVDSLELIDSQMSLTNNRTRCIDASSLDIRGKIWYNTYIMGNIHFHCLLFSLFLSVCVALWTGTAAAKETSNVNPPDRAIVVPAPVRIVP